MLVQFLNGAAGSGTGQQCYPVPEPDKVLDLGRTYTHDKYTHMLPQLDHARKMSNLAFLDGNVFVYALFNNFENHISLDLHEELGMGEELYSPEKVRATHATSSLVEPRLYLRYRPGTKRIRSL